MNMRISGGELLAAGFAAILGLGISIPAFGGTFDSDEPLMLDSSPMSNPADQRPAPVPTSLQPVQAPRLRSYEMPPVTVSDTALREDELIGSYAQPRWTADRKFAGTRTYVIPENQVEFEYWMRLDVPRHGSTEMKQMAEIEFGLPYRFQLDLYAVARDEAGGNTETLFDQQVELRWAFADWGKIWGNPTAYIEWANQENAPDKMELKLLLAGSIAPRWHWGQNLLWEWETGGEREYEYGWTGGISYSVIDYKFSVGAEAQFSLFDVQGDRGSFTNETFVGPSLQWRPSPPCHIDFTPLIGVTGPTGLAKILFVFGYEF